MNSDEKNDRKDEQDTAARQVMEYYSKYSQDKNLPKYFCGTSVSYIPKAVEDVQELEDKPGVPIPTIEVDLIVVPDTNVRVDPFLENQEEKPVSPSSSVTSNRKLEWDNGADIGYDNCQQALNLHRRSASLPVLSSIIQTKVDIKEACIKKETPASNGNIKIFVVNYTSSSEASNHETKENIQTSSSSASLSGKEIVGTCSSSSHDSKTKEQVYSSSSDSGGKERIQTFANTLSYLKRRIGLPDAHSTPKYLENRKSDPQISHTPSLKKSEITLATKKATKPQNIAKNKEIETDMHNIQNIKEACLVDKRTPDTCNEVNKSVSKLKDVHSNSGFIQGKLKNEEAFQRKKIVTLSLTDVVTVDCIDYSRNHVNKDVQTTINAYVSKCVQTDVISDEDLVKIIRSRKSDPGNQVLIFAEHSESDKCKSSSTQTSSDAIFSHCNSFEYVESNKNVTLVPSDCCSKGSDNNIILEETQPDDQKSASNAQQSSQKENRVLEESEKSSQQTSLKACYLANVISASQSDILPDDIEKNVELMQKLMKSKKYDAVTKKRYMKKIIQKIIDSKYMDESSNTSELFFPKKSIADHDKFPTNKKNVYSSDSSENRQETNLQSNLPWLPTEKPKMSPRRLKKLEIKTFTEEILPQPEYVEVQKQTSKEDISSPAEIIPTDSRHDILKTRSHFTLTNNEFAVNCNSLVQNSTKCSTNETTSYVNQADMELIGQNETNNLNSSVKSSSYQNWRDAKTMSEKLLEKKHIAGEGDYLIQFAKSERSHQINWIKNEISHLSKLKNLLEKPKSKLTMQSVSNSVSNLQKAHVEDMKGIKKTTTVYMISEKYNNNGYGNNTGESKPKNYVIHTELTTDSSDQAEYRFGNKSYCVKELYNRPTYCHKTRGDIEVVTDGSTTDIKVSMKPKPKRLCLKCQKNPCTCLNFSRDRKCKICSRHPCACFSKVSKIPCPVCGENTCLCICKTSKKMCCHKCMTNPCICTVPSSSETVCQKCKNMFCTCNDVHSSVCAKCHRISCGCSPEHRRKGWCRKCLKIPCDCADDKPAVPNSKCCLHCEKSPCVCDAEIVFNKPHFSDYKEENLCRTCRKSPCFCETGKFMHRDPLAVGHVHHSTFPRSKAELRRGTGLPSIREYAFETLLDNIKTRNETQKCSHSYECKCEFCKSSAASKAFHYDPLKTSSLQQRNILTNLDTVLAESAKTHHTTVGETKINPVTSILNKQQQTNSTEFCDKKSQTLESGVKVTRDHKVGNTVFMNTTQAQTEPDVKDCKSRNTQTILSNNKQRNSNPLPTRKTKCCCKCSKKLKDSGTTSPPIFYDNIEVQTDKVSAKKHSVRYTNGAQTDSKLQCGSSSATAKFHMESRTTFSSSERKDSSGNTLQESSMNSTLVSNSEEATFKSQELNSSNIYLEDSDESTDTLVTCACCKKKFSPDKITKSRSKFDLCNLCSQKNSGSSSASARFSATQNTCSCYSTSQADTLQQLKTAVDDLREIENYCSCTKPSSTKSSKYCTYCQCKLKRTIRSRNGIAYTLTIENEIPKTARRIRRKKKPSLEEIRVKIPCPYNRKRHKDRENLERKDSKPCVKHKGKYTCICEECSKTIKPQKSASYTLQEYLNQNRPDFINSAEYRRKVVQNSKLNRQENKDYLKLRFLEENFLNDKLKKQTRLFTAKEMKDITRKNYQKLPEVQEKLNNQREQQLKDASKLIADVFTKKLQNYVLTGKNTFPTDSNIVDII